MTEYYSEKKSKETYSGPFTFNESDFTIRNKNNECVAHITLAHFAYSLEKDRVNFGRDLCELLNNGK